MFKFSCSVVVMVAALIGLAAWFQATGRLERAVRSNRTAITIAKPLYESYSAARLAAVREYHTRFKDPAVVREYLSNHAVRKLQIGAGGNDVEGWLNSDIVPSGREIFIDASARFPLPDSSFQYVLSEHVIEHLEWEGGSSMLKECYRVLAPGGRIRTVTPNLAKFMQLLGGTPNPETRKFIESKIRESGWPVTPVPGTYIFNAQTHWWGHRFLYDPATLRKSLELAGFKQIRELPITDPTDPVFQQAEARKRNAGSDLWVINNWEAMAFEAVR